MRRVAAWVTVLLATGGAAAPASAAERFDVTVARTEFGIAHVKAKDFASLAYGYAQALAEDTICTLADAYMTSDAQRSRFLGPDARVTFRGNGSNASNVNSDIFFQRIIDEGRVEKLAKVAPPVGPKPEILEGVRGYVAGYNDWLAQQGGSEGIADATCKGKPWVKPIDEMTVLRRFYSLSLLASTGVAIDGIADARPASGRGRSAEAAARALEPGVVDERLGGLGSNAYGIGKDLSASGHGLVYGNPHFPWQGPERFFQAHLTIPGKLDVAGGSLIGVPLINIGHTKGMAWSHTVSTARRFVPYELKLAPNDPTSYVVDGQTRKMTAQKVTVKALVGGKLEDRTRTLYSSHHGPILTSLLGLPIFPWTDERAFAMHDGNADNFGRLLNHFFDFNMAQTVDEAEKILDKYLGIPWVNTIVADTAGNALYADVGSVPHIDRQKYSACQTALGVATDAAQRLPVLDGSRAACEPGRDADVGSVPHIDRQKYSACETALGVATDAAQRLPVLDGSRAACEPGRDADAIVPGILGPKQLPRLRRADHVSNMNDSYWLTNPAQPLEGFSRIIGDERTQRSLRTRVGIDMLRRSPKLTLDGLTTLGFSNRVYSGELWRDDLVGVCRQQPDLAAACPVLAGWNLRNDLDSKGAVLWQRFVVRLGAGTPAGLPGLPVALPGPAGSFSDAFDPARPVDTPAKLNTVSPSTAQALRDAMADVRGAGLPLDAPLRIGQTVTRRGEVIPIHGGPGGSGIFNVITPVWDPKKGYTEVVHGSSYIQAVELTPDCPRARTLLTYGQSTNPDSPRTSDQTKRFSEKAWVTPPFCPADLENDASATRLHSGRAGGVIATLAEARGTKRPRIVVRPVQAGRVRITIRRGKRTVRTIRRSGPVVAVSPKVRLGSYTVGVRAGGQRLTLRGKQRR